MGKEVCEAVGIENESQFPPLPPFLLRVCSRFVHNSCPTVKAASARRYFLEKYAVSPLWLTMEDEQDMILLHDSNNA